MSTTPSPIHFPPAKPIRERDEYRFRTPAERYKWILLFSLKALGVSVVIVGILGVIVSFTSWFGSKLSDSTMAAGILTMSLLFLLSGLIGPGRYFRWFPIQISRPHIGGVEPFNPLEVEGFIDTGYETDEVELYLNGEYIGSIEPKERFFSASVDISDIPHSTVNKVRASFIDKKTGKIHTDVVEFARLEKGRKLTTEQEAQLSAIKTPQQAYEIYHRSKPKRDYGAYAISFFLSGIEMLILLVLFNLLT